MPNEKNSINGIIAAAYKSLDERKELPLSVLKLSFSPHTVITPVFIDVNGEAGAAITSRFRSLQAIEQYLEGEHLAGHEIYLYKLYEQMVDYGGKPELTYTLRYSVRVGAK